MSKRMDPMKVQQWSERINAYEQSGLSRRAWCAQAGINVNTLDYWRVRLRGRRRDKASDSSGNVMTAIPVQVPTTSFSLTMRCGDIELHIPSTLPSTWVAALMRELRGC